MYTQALRNRHQPAASSTTAKPEPKPKNQTSAALSSSNIQEIFCATRRELKTVPDDVAVPAHDLPRLSWPQKVASYRTMAAIGRQVATSGCAARWSQRHLVYTEHVSKLTPWQCAMWAGKQLLGLILWPRLAVSFALFPSKRQVPSLPDAAELAAMKEAGYIATPQAIIGRDHTLLDGISIRQKNIEPEAGILVCNGNGALYDNSIAWYARLAGETHRPVFVYNYRGVGRSLGALHTTDDAVADVKDAICRVTRTVKAQGAKDIAVVGMSIGGGCATQAIDMLKREHVLGDTGVGHYVAVHSFRSLPAVISGLTGRIGGAIAQGWFTFTGANPLDSESVSRRSPLARHYTVVRASTDQVIAPAAALPIPPVHTTLNGTTTQVALLDNLGEGHYDIVPVLLSKSFIEALTKP